MRAGFRFLLAAFCVSALWALPVQAQPRAASGDCRALSAAYGAEKVWWGRFSGGRVVEGMRDRPYTEYRTRQMCFARRQACEAWLYRMRSDWQDRPRWSECVRGYRG